MNFYKMFDIINKEIFSSEVISACMFVYDWEWGPRIPVFDGLGVLIIDWFHNYLNLEDVSYCEPEYLFIRSADFWQYRCRNMEHMLSVNRMSFYISFII